MDHFSCIMKIDQLQIYHMCKCFLSVLICSVHLHVASSSKIDLLTILQSLLRFILDLLLVEKYCVKWLQSALAEK